MKALKRPLIPPPERKRLVQAEANADLFEAVKAELDCRGLHIRDAVNWGLAAFLMQTNPARAKEAGIEIVDLTIPEAK